MALATEGTAYTQAGATAVTQNTAPTSYRIGSRGNEVKVYQSALNNLGYNVGATDGIYGKMTSAQVMKFQQEHGLTADGVIGAQTIQAINDALAQRQQTQTEQPQAAQLQPDFYQVVNPAEQAQNQPDFYAVAPPTSQQLGAQAQATSEQLHGGGGRSFAPDTTPPTANLGIPNAPTVTQQPVQTTQPGSIGQTIEQYEDALMLPKVAPPPQATAVTPVSPQMPSKGSGTGSGLSMVASPAQTVTAGGSAATGVSPEVVQNTANMTGLQGMANQLYEQMNTMSPEWNADADPEYQRDAVQLENKVAQMMVARGGLYSSVARAALSSSMIDLELGYRKQAYERFINERDFVFKQLAFVSERIDAEFQKSMTLKNYELAVQKEQFDQQMAIAQFKAEQAARAASLSIQRAQLKASQERAAAEKQLAYAASQQQATYNKLNNEGVQLKVQKQKLSNWIDDYYKHGTLSAEAQSYLGVSPSDGIIPITSAVKNRMSFVETQVADWQSRVVSFGDAQFTLEAYSDLFKKSTAPTKTTVTNYIMDDTNTRIGETTSTYGG